MSLNAKLCEIADAGPMVHLMDWEEIGKACGDASLRLAALEECIRKIYADIPGGQSCDPAEIATRVEELAKKAKVSL